MKDDTKGPASGATRPRQFRLGDDALADLDLIAEHHTAETGVTHTRTDAVRLAAKREADRIRKLKKQAEDKK
jgi:hypothetical protein